jgi:hypothetical protein
MTEEWLWSLTSNHFPVTAVGSISVILACEESIQLTKWRICEFYFKLPLVLEIMHVRVTMKLESRYITITISARLKAKQKITKTK